MCGLGKRAHSLPLDDAYSTSQNNTPFTELMDYSYYAVIHQMHNIMEFIVLTLEEKSDLGSKVVRSLLVPHPKT